MIEEKLEQLKMMGALDFYRSIKPGEIDAEVLIETLLAKEIEWKADRRLNRRLKVADFPYPKEWAEIDENENPQIDFNSLKKLSNGEFIKEKKNLCLIGAPGLGKTHSLVSIGRDLCRLGYTVKFITAIDLVTRLEEAKQDHRLSKELDRLKKFNLLIIDELGFVPLSDTGARLLFDVFSKRYETGSIAVSTNLAFNKWTETFGSLELTSALIDRFTHHCDIFLFKGNSYRLKESIKTQVKSSSKKTRKKNNLRKK